MTYLSTFKGTMGLAMEALYTPSVKVSLNDGPESVHTMVHCTLPLQRGTYSLTDGGPQSCLHT